MEMKKKKIRGLEFLGNAIEQILLQGVPLKKKIKEQLFRTSKLHMRIKADRLNCNT